MTDIRNVGARDIHGCSLDICQAQINLKKTISEPLVGIEPTTF